MSGIDRESEETLLRLRDSGRTMTAEAAQALLSYDPETGKFKWKPRPPELFKSQSSCKSWNDRFANMPTMNTDAGHGYLSGCVFGKTYRSHRVAWLITTGAWPFREIDHINGDPSDNRIENLRDVTRQENCRNMPIAETNKSGIIGVCFDEQKGTWASYITVDGKNIWLGHFREVRLAIVARRAGERALGFHRNHGRKRIVPRA